MADERLFTVVISARPTAATMSAYSTRSWPCSSRFSRIKNCFICFISTTSWPHPYSPRWAQMGQPLLYLLLTRRASKGLQAARGLWLPFQPPTPPDYSSRSATRHRLPAPCEIPMPPRPACLAASDCIPGCCAMSCDFHPAPAPRDAPPRHRHIFRVRPSESLRTRPAPSPRSHAPRGTPAPTPPPALSRPSRPPPSPPPPRPVPN